MSVELHLPDLPEVPISIGPAPGRVRAPRPWPLRLRDALSTYLPLLLMGLLALATWWLVKQSPPAPAGDGERPPSTAPDYTMTDFSLDHFDAAGRLAMRIEGERLRHYPATDRIEIDGPRIRAIAPDGRETLAHAERALAAGDGSEVQLLGGAEVRSTDRRGAPLLMQGEFLHALLVLEQVRSHLPVLVRASGSELHAAGLDYDHAAGRLELKGPLRATLPPRAGAAR